LPVITTYYIHGREIKPENRKTRTRFRNLLVLLFVFILIIGLPYLILSYQAGKNGSTPVEVLKWMMSRESTTDSLSAGQPKNVTYGEKIDFLVPQHVGLEFKEPPMISNLAVTDLDKDGFPEIIVCDGKK